MTEVFSPDVGPHCMPLTREQELAGRVAFLEGAVTMARDKIAALEQACGLPALGPLTLEQRVQSLEIAWADIVSVLLPKVELLQELGKRLSEDLRRVDTPAPEVPPT